MSAVLAQQTPNSDWSRQWPFVASFGFHIAVVILLILIGLEWGYQKPERLEVISVDLIIPDAPMAKITEMPEETPPEQPLVPEEKREEPATEQAKEQEHEIAPQSVQEAPPPMPEPAPQPEETPDITEQAAPSLAPQNAPVPLSRPKPPAKQEEAEEVKETETQAKPDFASVLKNLAENKEAAREDDNRQSPMLTQPPPVGQALTQSELAALKRQLAMCWNILPGARDADHLVVTLSLSINADRTVASARVKEQARLSDPFFNAAAESALRAIRDPRCSPLALPPFKYDQWKEMTIRFDPKDMF